MVMFHPLYTLEEARALLRLTEADFRELLQQDRMPYVILCGREFVRGRDLENFLNGLTGL